MGTVNEILTEAFNRVKAEHGITLSQVDFNDTTICGDDTGYKPPVEIDASEWGLVL